jgi:hypothetical protein
LCDFLVIREVMDVLWTDCLHTTPVIHIAQDSQIEEGKKKPKCCMHSIDSHMIIKTAAAAWQKAAN